MFLHLYVVSTEIIFLLDISGSMSGERLIAAKLALESLVEELPETSYFNIVLFESEIESFYDSTIEATPSNKEDAIAKLKPVESRGGTVLLAPLEKVYATPPRDGYVRQIFVLTDGYCDSQADILILVSQHRSDHRIFSVGISAGVDRKFIEDIAVNSGGRSAFVLEGSEIKVAAQKFFRESLSPAIIDVKVEVEGGVEYATVPHPIKALFLNTITYLFLRKRQWPRDSFDIHITGRNGNRPFELHLAFADHDSPIRLEKFFGEFWMMDLRMIMMRFDSSNTDEIKKADLEISLNSGVLSPFTALHGVPNHTPVTDLLLDFGGPQPFTDAQSQASDEFEKCTARESVQRKGAEIKMGGLTMPKVIEEAELLAPITTKVKPTRFAPAIVKPIPGAPGKSPRGEPPTPR
jgi:uncharacterized protein YegL